MEYSLTDLSFLFWMVPLAYLIGSIPTAVWIGKAFHGIDVREHGSGNAGATNVMRVLGVRTGIPVLLFDMVKGFTSVYLGRLQTALSTGDEFFVILSILLGVFAVIGHIYPIFAGFRGGKGVATIAGVCFALQPAATASALAVFILVLIIWKYVSVASISAGFSFPIWVILAYRDTSLSLAIFSVLAALLLVYTHRKNISRLLQGTEGKASFLFRKQ